MKILLLIMLLAVSCWGQNIYYPADWFVIGEPKGIDLSEYFKECPVCEEPFNYEVKVSTSLEVEETEEFGDYFGRKMHKHCLGRLIDFQIEDYKKREKEVLLNFGDLTVSNAVLMSSITFISNPTPPKIEKSKKKWWQIWRKNDKERTD